MLHLIKILLNELYSFKLKTFWRKTNASLKWKLEVYNAIVISQLVYGLETLQLTDSLLCRLNAFHIRGLRQILCIDHAYYSGISNEDVLHRARVVLNNDQNTDIEWQQFYSRSHKDIILIADIIIKRQRTLLGHILRADDDDDIMKVVTLGFCPVSVDRPTQHRRRVGRPRKKWLDDNLERTYYYLYEENYNYSEDSQWEIIIAALERHF